MRYTHFLFLCACLTRTHFLSRFSWLNSRTGSTFCAYHSLCLRGGTPMPTRSCNRCGCYARKMQVPIHRERGERSSLVDTYIIRSTYLHKLINRTHKVRVINKPAREEHLFFSPFKFIVINSCALIRLSQPSDPTTWSERTGIKLINNELNTFLRCTGKHRAPKRSLRRRFMMQKNRKESLSRTFIRLRRRTFRLQRGESGVGSSSARRTQSVQFSRPLNNGSLRRTQEGGRTTHSTQNYAKFACVLSKRDEIWYRLLPTVWWVLLQIFR